MPMFALAEPETSALSLLPSTVLHSLLVAAAIAASQAVPTTVPNGPIEVALTWHAVSTTNTPVVSGGHVDFGVPPIGSDPVPDIPSIPDVPMLPGGSTLDPRGWVESLPPCPDPCPAPTLSYTPGVLSVTEVDDPPSLLAAGPLRYPQVLREAGITGSVTLSFIIDAEGQVERDGIEVVSSTHPGFVAAAIETIRASRFHAARSHGQAVRVKVRQTVAFRN